MFSPILRPVYAPLEYRQMVEAQHVLMERVREKETSDKDLASLIRSLCMLVTTKREWREASRARREPRALFPAKESLLIESTPGGTTPEGG